MHARHYRFAILFLRLFYPLVLPETINHEKNLNVQNQRLIHSYSSSFTGKVEEGRIYVPYQNYHDHHHEHHWGPYFEDEQKYTQLTAHVGSEALLNCRVVMLKDKTVSLFHLF